MTHHTGGITEEHEHKWSDWVDDKKPINVESQKELILLSFRKCTSKDCDKVQSRIGRIKAKS